MSDARSIPLSGIRRLNLSDAQDAISPLHRYLRQCVLDGTLEPGTKLSQSALARQLGVSRTPLREALRMLQQEGLVAIEHNQRTTVAPLVGAELDQLYGTRIALETLAVSMTSEQFGPRECSTAMGLVSTMIRCTERGDVTTWLATLVPLQDMLRSGAHESLRQQLKTLAELALRYIRVFGVTDPKQWLPRTDLANLQIVEALGQGDVGGAVSALADHMATNARAVLAEIDPHYVPIAVPHALELVGATTLRAAGLDATG